MTEAERYLEEKLKRDAGVKSGAPEADGGKQSTLVRVSVSPVVGETRQEPAESVQPAVLKRGAQGGSGGTGGGKGWGFVMAGFAILMTLIWMAVFKGGCR